MKRITKIIFLIVTCGIFFPLKLNAQDGLKIYYNAKMLMHQQEYDKALKKYELLKKKYPNSKYLDDAEFWTGYILEQKGEKKKAFDIYQNLVSKKIESPWIDDAIIHQIGIAEELATGGEKPYLNFLAKQLNSKNKNIKYQSSLSLGKLRDKRAIPALKQMANNGDKDMCLMAKSILNNFKKPIHKSVQPSYNGKKGGTRPLPLIQSKTSKASKTKTIKPSSSRKKNSTSTRQPSRNRISSPKNSSSGSKNSSGSSTKKTSKQN